MNHDYHEPHHEDQNAVTEVGVPDPHQPGCRPPRAEGLVTEADAFYEGLGMGAYFPSMFGAPAPERGMAVGPGECSPDQRGCGCPDEPTE